MAELTRTRIKRNAARGVYDRKQINQILDSHHVCHVGYVQDGEPRLIPTLYIRQGDFIYLHGNRQSALLGAAATGAVICISVFSADGIVVARSGFHCSMNYRSVVVFGPGEAVPRDEFEAVLNRFVGILIPGHDKVVREPTRQELDATAVVRVAIEEAAAKVRVGDPIDATEDLDAEVWAGVIPLETRTLAPVASANLDPGIRLPDYLRS